MKKIIYISIALTLMLFVSTSCDDFLDQNTSSNVTEEGLGIKEEDGPKYTTAEQAEQLLQSVYRLFDSEFWQLDIYRFNECQSDNAYAGEDKPDALQLNEFRLQATNEVSSRDWGYLFKQIAAANSTIQWVPLITDQALTTARKKEIIAEASFLRALCYFHLVRIYGDVPLTLKELPSISNDNIEEIYPLIYPTRLPKDSIYLQIVKDLEIAVDDAPGYSDYKFRATKAISNFLLAEVYATKDVASGRDKTDWASVKKYASAVCSDTRYSLMTKYDDLFAIDGTWNGSVPSTNLKNENSKESLFEIDFTGGDSGMGNWGASMFYGTNWKKFNTPSHDLYDAFTAAGDIQRRDASIFFDNVTGKWGDIYWTNLSQYPFPYKLRAGDKGNMILYRLPEAILLLAEAENELGNLSAAQRLINTVRNRVGLADTNANSKESMRLAIENEHRFEFAFEAKRWFDLVRRGRAIEVMKNCTDTQSKFAVQNLNENRLIWPVPQKERDVNENLTQNSGY